MKTRLLRITRAGILDPRAYASDSAAVMHRKALGSRLQEGGVVAVIFQFRFLTHSVDVIRPQDHLEKPKQIAHSLLNSFVYYVYSRPAETDLT